jgi:hypothetical protein
LRDLKRVAVQAFTIVGGVVALIGFTIAHSYWSWRQQRKAGGSS